MKYNFTVKYGDDPSEYSRQWRALNADKKRKGDREWRDNNRIRKAASDRLWAINNLEKKHENQRRYYLRHRDKLAKKQKAFDRTEILQRYYQKNKTTVLQRNKEWSAKNVHLVQANKSARRTGEESKRDVAELIKSVRKSKKVRCFYCDVKLNGQRVHIDHFVSVKNGGKTEVGNLVASCPSCNHRKSGKNGNEFKRGQLILIV